MQADTKKDETNFIQKVWRYRKKLVIEPFVLCWILPICFLSVGTPNLALEKACRVTLGYSKDLCDNVLYKDINQIDCDDFEEDENITISRENLIAGTFDYNYTACKAEIETHEAIAYINGIRTPIAAIFHVIVILFAGGWSDRKGLRKPCMIFPLIGDTLGTAALLISSIFMETIPMEFGTILEKVLPAMLGGYTLMVLGIFSYLTAATPEEDRIFRFGIFGMFTTIVSLAGLPFAGILLDKLGYVYLFLLGCVVMCLGVIYMIFFVPEAKAPVKLKSSANGDDNLAFEMASTDNAKNAKNSIPKDNNEEEEKEETPKKRNCLVDFFDPTLAYSSIQVFFKKREKNRRFYIISLGIAYTLFVGPNLGEADYFYQFCLKKLQWSPDQYSFYLTYNRSLSIVGTFFMTTVFSKMLKMPDSLIGLLASTCTIISRPMFAFSKESVLFYAAQAVDIFVGAKTYAIKTLIASMVDAAEIGRVYSVLGLTDAIGGFIFPPMYSKVYSSTVQTFPGAFFLFGEIFFIPNAIPFIITYFALRRQKKEDAENQNKTEEDENKEVSHM